MQRARTVPGEVRPEKIQALTMTFARELAAAGAGAGAAAAAPMVGTAATVLASTAELAWFTSRAGDLILTVAALHGRPEPSVDERRAWVLAVLIYGSTAREGLTRAMNEANTGLSPATSSRIPITTVQSANRILSKLILKRYGTRRGVVAVGNRPATGHRGFGGRRGQLPGGQGLGPPCRRVLLAFAVLGDRCHRHGNVRRSRPRPRPRLNASLNQGPEPRLRPPVGVRDGAHRDRRRAATRRS